MSKKYKNIKHKQQHAVVVPPPAPRPKLGRRAVLRDSRTLNLMSYVDHAQLPPPPSAVDLTVGLPTNLGMMLNDSLGDCTIAALGHAVQVWTNLTGKIVTVPDSTILSLYEKFDGYVNGDPSTDQGGIELNVLKQWQQTPSALPAPLIAFGTIGDLKNHTLVQQALNLFSGLYIGFEVPDSVFNSKYWDVPANINIVGGHAVFVTGYDINGLSLISWGSIYHMTWAFWDRFVDEAYALLSPSEIGTNGLAKCGFNEAQLALDIKAITA